MSSLSQLSDSVAAEEEGQVVGRTLLKACSTRACPAKTAGRGGVRERSSNRYLSRVATCAAQIVRLHRCSVFGACDSAVPLGACTGTHGGTVYAAQFVAANGPLPDGHAPFSV